MSPDAPYLTVCGCGGLIDPPGPAAGVILNVWMANWAVIVWFASAPEGIRIGGLYWRRINRAIDGDAGDLISFVGSDDKGGGVTVGDGLGLRGVQWTPPSPAPGVIVNVSMANWASIV